MRFLLGDCFGRCVFSHEKTYLPSGRWWESEEKRAEVQKMSTWDIVKDIPGTLPKCLAGIDGRIQWKPNHAAKTEEAYVWKNSIIKLESLGDLTHDMAYANFMTRVRDAMARWPGHGHRSGQHDKQEQGGSEESEERSSNGGFDVNPADVCQCEGPPKGPWFGGYYDSADNEFHVSAWFDHLIFSESRVRTSLSKLIHCNPQIDSMSLSPCVFGMLRWDFNMYF